MGRISLMITFERDVAKTLLPYGVAVFFLTLRRALSEQEEGMQCMTAAFNRPVGQYIDDSGV